MNLEEIAKFWRTRCRSDEEFVRVINKVVEELIDYRQGCGWTVLAPERALRERQGDCSEKALLKVAMLASQGIDCHVVHGIFGGIPHDTVEVHLGHYVTFINQAEEDGKFTKLGDGLDPREVVVS